MLLASMMGAKDADASGSNVTFTTDDGTAYKVTFSSKKYGSTNHGAAWLYISLGGDTSNWTLYNYDKKKPKAYKFIVRTDGSVLPCNDDTLAAAYIKNPSKTNDKKADYELAKELKGTLPTSLF